MDDQHGEPTSDAMARAAQALAVTVSLVEALARLRAQRAHTAAEQQEQAVAAARTAQALRHDSARLLWTPAFDEHTVRRMSATELLDSWSAATAYRDHDPGARHAAQRLEERLHQLHPEAMSAYDDAVRNGQRPDLAMQHALHLFRGEYGLDPVGTPLHIAEAAGHEQQARSAGRSDDRTTTTDEATTASLTATVHDGAAARARALADISQPVSIEDAMAAAPRAAKALLALPPAPSRRQITATPTVPRVPTGTR